ncbi:MAG: MarR family winged helix-turn-helix transcriptional regulator [Lachnospiraceae bacterium]
MESYNTLNEVLVHLFNDIMDIEEKAMSTGEFKDISNKDIHVLSAIGIHGARNMSSVAKTLSITVGTLTIAINNLLKKGYVDRVRSDRDRRVVLVSLTSKGEKAYRHHADFHEKMVQAILKDLNQEETEILTKTLTNLSSFFLNYNKSTD